MKYIIIILLFIVPASPLFCGDFMNPVPGGNDFLNPDYTAAEAAKKSKAQNMPGSAHEGIFAALGFDFINTAPNVFFEFWSRNFAVDIWIYGHRYSYLSTSYNYYTHGYETYAYYITGVSFGVEARYFFITGVFAPSVSVGISPDIVGSLNFGLNARASVRICPAYFLFIEPFAGAHLTLGNPVYFQTGLMLGFKL